MELQSASLQYIENHITSNFKLFLYWNYIIMRIVNGKEMMH